MGTCYKLPRSFISSSFFPTRDLSFASQSHFGVCVCVYMWTIFICPFSFLSSFYFLLFLLCVYFSFLFLILSCVRIVLTYILVHFSSQQWSKERFVHSYVHCDGCQKKDVLFC